MRRSVTARPWLSRRRPWGADTALRSAAKRLAGGSIEMRGIVEDILIFRCSGRRFDGARSKGSLYLAPERAKCGNRTDPLHPGVGGAELGFRRENGLR